MSVNISCTTEYRRDIILASASPRRREMFQERGIPVKISPSGAEESLPMDMSPEAAVMYLALTKAMDVAKRERGLIIAADTVVLFQGEIMGKPSDEEDAFRMLSNLRGNCHQVLSGVCIIDSSAEGGAGGPTSTKGLLPGKYCLWDMTRVYFKNYSDKELRAYVKTDEPYDKAGGYAIQMTFGRYIDHIEGDRDNVIGFPMYRVEPFLRRREVR